MCRRAQDERIFHGVLHGFIPPYIEPSLTDRAWTIYLLGSHDGLFPHFNEIVNCFFCGVYPVFGVFEGIGGKIL